MRIITIEILSDEDQGRKMLVGDQICALVTITEGATGGMMLARAYVPISEAQQAAVQMVTHALAVIPQDNWPQ